MRGEQSTSKPTTNANTKRKRVAFIDQARALAILLMLFGHPMQHYLGEPWRSSAFWQEYQFVRGVTSALFLTVSGFSFVIATLPHWSDYLRLSERMFGRLNRIALIAFLGYVLHLWAPTLNSSIASFDAVVWERFWSFGILQNVSVAMLLLHGLVALSRRPERFVWAAAALCLGVIGIAPLTYSPAVDSHLPTGLASALNMFHQSRFPVVPWTAFVLLGAVFGGLYRARRDQGDEWKVFVAASVFGFALILFEQFIRQHSPSAFYPYSAGQPMTPGNIFARGGCSLLVISALYAIGRVRIILPRFSLALSRETLTIYFTHIVIVYGLGALGSPLFTPEGMPPFAVIAGVVALIALMTAAAYGIGWMRRQRPRLLVLLRHWLIGSALTAFIAWPSLTPTAVAASVIAVGAVMIGRERLRARARQVVTT